MYPRVRRDLEFGEVVQLLRRESGPLHVFHQYIIESIGEVLLLGSKGSECFPSGSLSNGPCGTMGEIHTYFITWLKSGSRMTSEALGIQGRF